jgi:low affinity Fe/Cu permease
MTTWRFGESVTMSRRSGREDFRPSIAVKYASDAPPALPSSTEPPATPWRQNRETRRKNYKAFSFQGPRELNEEVADSLHNEPVGTRSLIANITNRAGREKPVSMNTTTKTQRRDPPTARESSARASSKQPTPHVDKNVLERFSEAVCSAAGSSSAFGLACLVIVAWALTGPLFGYSDTWQLIINTGTTIVTFLMVFLIQRSQNKESLAVQLKLNEVVAAVNGASNRLIDVEALSEADLNTLREHYQHLVSLARKEGALTESHSVEEAQERHDRKVADRRGGKSSQSAPGAQLTLPPQTDPA